MRFLKASANSSGVFFLCYAKAIKIQEGRTGSLFEKNFKRQEVGTDAYLVHMINYIHRNPQKHGIAPDYQNYPYSSYRSMLSERPTRLKRSEVLEWFGGAENFVRYHEEHVL